MTTTVGIDPGLTGAIAFLEPGQPSVEDAPVVNREMNPAGMVALLRGPDIGLAVIERVGAMPKQGVASTFRFGFGCGVGRGVVAAMGIPIMLVTPQEWKREFGLIGQPKEASREKALQLFPELSGELDLKKHHGRADALLIAEWGRRRLAGALKTQTKPRR